MSRRPDNHEKCGCSLRSRAAAVAAVALISLAGARFAHAQVPAQLKLPGSDKQAAAAPAQAQLDLQKLRARVEQDLAQWRGRLERIRAGSVPPAPAGITPEEITKSHETLAVLVQINENVLDTLARIGRHREARESAEQAEQSWAGFKQAAPYSVLLLDNVREEADQHRAVAELLKSSNLVAGVDQKRFLARVEQANEAVRRAVEALGGVSPETDERAAAQWRLEAARESAKLADALVLGTRLVSRELDNKLAISQAELRLAERKLAALAGKVSISKADLEKAHGLLNSIRADRERELRSLIAADIKQARERAQALKELEALRAGKVSPARSTGRDRALQLAEAKFRATDDASQSLKEQIRIFTVLVNLYHTMVVEAWEHRYTVLTGGDPDARQRAREQIDTLVEYLKSWGNLGRIRQGEMQAALRGQDQRVQSASDPAIEKYEREALESLRRLDRALELQRNVVDRRIARIGHWRQEFNEAIRARSLGGIAGEILARAKVIALQVWDYELLAIEDTVEVGGQKLTTTRGVTVGKSVGAILLFLIGYRLMRFVALRAERLLVRRFKIGEEQGKTLRRWAEALGVFLLLLLTLNIARIPLTVFAFAGGALAIGIGFGTQTLIKNLISGMVVLMERQIKVGDIVEVDGITGRVTEVNIRSSTVRGFDGVESMVPNSMLLEQKVTNWTLSNNQLRRVVRVGVAYGSPAREAAHVLADCADRHGIVLKDPAPRVIFEDFGDNALIFALYFWIDLTPEVNTLQVMSDLRFMIEKQLGEAGIVVAYPQRDVHFDASRPLKVEVIQPGGGTAAGT